MYNLETIMEELIEKSLSNSADSYREKSQFEISKRLYFKALKLQKKLLIVDKDHYGSLILTTLNSLATIYKEENNYTLAIQHYKQSIFMIEEVLNSSFRRYRYVYVLAKNYTDVANLYRREYRYEEAEFFYNEALKTYRSLSQEDFDASKIKVLTIYNYLSIICNEQNKLEETKNAYMGALAIYQYLVKSESDRYRPELARTLSDLASLYFKHNRQNKAGEVYLLALEILLYLYQKEPREYKEMLALTLHRLAQIYTAQHEHTNALSAYRESLNHYITLAEEEPSQYASYVALIFEDLASFYRSQKKMKMAKYFHIKLIDLYTELNHYNEYKYSLKLASSIIDGVAYYQQHTLSLYQAEAIIKIHNENRKGNELLEQIYSLRYEKSPVF